MHTEYLYILEYKRNGTHTILPIYRRSEQEAVEFSAAWSVRLHVEVIGVKRVSQWVIHSGAALPGEISVPDTYTSP